MLTSNDFFLDLLIDSCTSMSIAARLSAPLIRLKRVPFPQASARSESVSTCAEFLVLEGEICRLEFLSFCILHHTNLCGFQVVHRLLPGWDYGSCSPNTLDYCRPILLLRRWIFSGHCRSMLQCEFRSTPSIMSRTQLHSGMLQ